MGSLPGGPASIIKLVRAFEQQRTQSLAANPQDNTQSILNTLTDILTSQAGGTNVKTAPLSTAKTHDAWEYRLTAELGDLGVDAIVEEQLAGRHPSVTPIQQKKLDAVARSLRGNITGEASTLIQSARAKTVAEIIKAVEPLGVVNEVDKQGLLKSFHSDKWNPSAESIWEWSSKKYRTAKKIPQEIPESAVESNMRSAIHPSPHSLRVY